METTTAKLELKLIYVPLDEQSRDVAKVMYNNRTGKKLGFHKWLGILLAKAIAEEKLAAGMVGIAKTQEQAKAVEPAKAHIKPAESVSETELPELNWF